MGGMRTTRTMWPAIYPLQTNHTTNYPATNYPTTLARVTYYRHSTCLASVSPGGGLLLLVLTVVVKRISLCIARALLSDASYTPRYLYTMFLVLITVTTQVFILH